MDGARESEGGKGRSRVVKTDPDSFTRFRPHLAHFSRDFSFFVRAERAEGVSSKRHRQALVSGRRVSGLSGSNEPETQAREAAGTVVQTAGNPVSPVGLTPGVGNA